MNTSLTDMQVAHLVHKKHIRLARKAKAYLKRNPSVKPQRRLRIVRPLARELTRKLAPHAKAVVSPKTALLELYIRRLAWLVASGTSPQVAVKQLRSLRALFESRWEHQLIAELIRLGEFDQSCSSPL